MNNNIKIFFDTETTGQNFRDDRILELGFTITEGNKILEEYQQYLNPEKSSSYEAFLVHGISDEFLKDKPKFKDVYHKIVDALVKYNPHSITIHNSGFDCKMLSQEFARLYSDHNIHVIDYLKEKYPDFILEKNRNYYYDETTNSYLYTGKTVSELKRSDYTFSLMDILPVEDTMLVAANFFNTKISLDELAKNLNVDASQRKDLHGALVDADLTFRCYLKLKETYLKEYDFIDLTRNLKGMNIPRLEIKDTDRIPEDLAKQLLDLSQNNGLSLNSEPLKNTYKP